MSDAYKAILEALEENRQLYDKGELDKETYQSQARKLRAKRRKLERGDVVKPSNGAPAKKRTRKAKAPLIPKVTREEALGHIDYTFGAEKYQVNQMKPDDRLAYEGDFHFFNIDIARQDASDQNLTFSEALDLIWNKYLKRWDVTPPKHYYITYQGDSMILALGPVPSNF